MALIMVGSVTLTPIFAATEEDDDYLFSNNRSEDLMVKIVDLIDTVLANPENEGVIKTVREEVNKTMKDYPLFAY